MIQAAKKVVEVTRRNMPNSIDVMVSIEGVDFEFRCEVPDIRGTIMASDMNEKWLKQRIIEALRTALGKVNEVETMGL